MNATTGFAFNELIYNFKVTNIFQLFNTLLENNYECLRILKRKKVENAIAFANAVIKKWYDHYHKQIDLKLGNLVYFTFYCGYRIFGISNRKLI